MNTPDPQPMEVEVKVEPSLAPVTKDVNYHLDVVFRVDDREFGCSGILRLSPSGPRVVRTTYLGCFADPADAQALLEETWGRVMKLKQDLSLLQPWTCSFWADAPRDLSAFNAVYQWLCQT